MIFPLPNSKGLNAIAKENIQERSSQKDGGLPVPTEIRARIARDLGGPWSQQPHVTNLRATSRDMNEIWAHQSPPRAPGENLAVVFNRQRFPWRALYELTLQAPDDSIKSRLKV